MKIFSSLSREQKEAIGLLQIGTFLEYFDLMLYVHMAVLLNELFFPQTDPQTASLLAAFAFCSTYVLRPLGALIFGWIGDTVGRKSTIIMTTVMMSLSCIFMANLPTYDQIGITAAWVVTLCRMAQGMSSLGEIMGAEIYVAEIIKPPASYPAVAFISIASSLGTMFALAVSALVTSFYMNWRLAFWIGAVIALVGSVARTRLRETPDFVDMKRRMKKAIEDSSHGGLEKAADLLKNTTAAWKEKVRFKTSICYFLVYCGWPLSFYLAYIYFNPLLKENFGYSANNIIIHNFFLSVLLLVSNICWTILSCFIHPLKILKARGITTLAFMILLPFLVMKSSSPVHLFCIQSLILILTLGGLPADAVFIYHFPVFRRFTLTSFIYALTRAFMYILTSFGLVYLGNYFGPFGLWFITLPTTLAFLYGVWYFEGLERQYGNLS